MTDISHRRRLGTPQSSFASDSEESLTDDVNDKEALLSDALLSLEEKLKSDPDVGAVRKLRLNLIRRYFNTWKCVLDDNDKDVAAVRITRPKSSSELAAKVLSLEIERERREVTETATVLSLQVEELRSVLRDQDEVLADAMKRINQLEWHRLFWALISSISVPGLVLALLSHDLDLHDWEATWELLALWGVGVTLVLVLLWKLVQKLRTSDETESAAVFSNVGMEKLRAKHSDPPAHATVASASDSSWPVVNTNTKGLRRRKSSSNKRKPSGKELRNRMNSTNWSNQVGYVDQRTVAELTV